MTAAKCPCFSRCRCVRSQPIIRARTGSLFYPITGARSQPIVFDPAQDLILLKKMSRPEPLNMASINKYKVARLALLKESTVDDSPTTSLDSPGYRDLDAAAFASYKCESCQCGTWANFGASVSTLACGHRVCASCAERVWCYTCTKRD